MVDNKPLIILKNYVQQKHEVVKQFHRSAVMACFQLEIVGDLMAGTN